MPSARTLMGVEYQYSGSLDTDLIIHKKIDIHISANTISLIRTEIIKRSPILMGAPAKRLNRRNVDKEWVFSTVFELCNSSSYRRKILQGKRKTTILNHETRIKDKT
jgi:hypothetical protein